MARAKKSKVKVSELEGQPDPRAPLDSAGLLSACQGVLARLEADLLERAKSSPAVTRALEARYQAEKAAERTAESFAGWTALLATQVGAAWVLSCVFVRTLEDRGLLKQVRLAGPGAEDSQRQFFQLAPSLTERDYLLTIFRELAHHPAARDLFDTEHSPIWKLSPSAAAAKELLALFRMPNATTPAFRFGQASTRFLGDLYQDLSEDVRKRYALLQTPDFIESFILDRTLEPAIQRFGLDDTTLIDPTCGSGHFLLGAFDRLFEHRLRAEPGIDPRVAAVKALDCVYGADINPYAVAIARFRLTLSFLEKAGYAKLAEAPALPLHLVVADSLRINAQHPQTELWQQEGVSSQGWLGEVFALEDELAARDALFRQYAAVVGNPPYITVKDAAMREIYRKMYKTAVKQYSLAAPFCERFFQLARPRGYVGQITANSFMKREFGKILIEEFLPSVNLDYIANTSGAHIPGHGTPTVLLFGTHELPHGRDILAVLAKRGEPSVPEDPKVGNVWASIAQHGAEVGFENDYVSVARVGRDELARHPWSLGGGGASELKLLLEERSARKLSDLVDSIGRTTVAGEDEIWIADQGTWERLGLQECTRPLVTGESVRDWVIVNPPEVLYPYKTLGGEPVELDHCLVKHLWPWRTTLEQRTMFGKQIKATGRRWWEHLEHYSNKLRTPFSITFAFVATHNHFVLERGGKVFNRSAPIIKLHKDASEEDYLSLLAYINSSVACFWMKQVFFDKGNQGGERGRPSEPFEAYFEFDGTKMAALPLPIGFEDSKAELAAFARDLNETSLRRLQLLDVSSVFAESQSSAQMHEKIAERLDLVREVEYLIRSIQEELDWSIYRLFGLTGHVPRHFDGREPGARLCDYRWARDALVAESSIRYFELCHSGDPYKIADPAWVKKWDLAADEDAALRSNAIGIIETPAYKRTYKDSFGPVDVRVQGVLHLTRELELNISMQTGVMALRDLSLELRRKSSPTLDWCEEFNPGVIADLMTQSSVPFVAGSRYSESGMEKFAQWSALWQQQRAQDLGDQCSTIPAPKYTDDDFSDHNYYRIRGKLDVPKERFISYPGCESDNDGEPVYGWAGWDHLQRAKALASMYLNRKDVEGWTADRLTPMLAGLLELIPWVKQWHNEPSEEFGGLRMGDYYEQFLDGECRVHGLTHDDLRAWRPVKKTRGSAKPAKAKATKADDEATESSNGPGDDEAPAAKKPRRKKQAPAAEKELPNSEEAE